MNVRSVITPGLKREKKSWAPESAPLSRRLLVATLHHGAFEHHVHRACAAVFGLA